LFDKTLGENMKKLVLMLIVLFGQSTFGAFDSLNIANKVDIKGFIAGDDGKLGGQFSYIVDRKSNLCFAVLNGRGNSMVNIPCNSLTKIEAIKTYIETGKTVSK